MKMLKVLLSALFVVAMVGCKKPAEDPKPEDKKPPVEKPAEGGEDKPAEKPAEGSETE